MNCCCGYQRCPYCGGYGVVPYNPWPWYPPRPLPVAPWPYQPTWPPPPRFPYYQCGNAGADVAKARA